MNPKDFTVQKILNDKEHYYIANKDNVFVLKNGNISRIFFHCYWESKVEAEIFLAGWLSLQPTPVFNANQVDYEPQHELGTRHIAYINGIRTVHKYCKLDFGTIGTDAWTGKTYRNIQYRWLCVRM